MSKRKRPKAPNGSGSVRWRADRQLYEAAVTVGLTPAGNPKRIYASFDRKEDAEHWRMQQLLDLDAGTIILPDDTTVAELLQRYDEAHPKWADSTRADNVGILELHVVPHLGRVKVKDLTKAHVSRLITILESTTSTSPGTAGKPLSERFVRRVISRLSRLLNYAVEVELVGRNVTAGFNKTALPAKRRPRWTQAETRAALAWCAAHESTTSAYFYTALTTGMRKEELKALTWDHIDFLQKRIHVKGVAVADKSGALIFRDSTKSLKGDRTIEIDDATVGVLLRQQTRVAELKAAHDGVWPEQDLAFPTKRGTPLGDKRLRRALDEIQAATGNPRIWIYDTRRTHFSILAELGVSPVAIQVRAGHASAAFSMSTYVEPVVAEQLAIAQVFHGLGVPQPAATESAAPVQRTLSEEQVKVAKAVLAALEDLIQ